MTTRSLRWLPLLALTATLAAGSTSFAADKNAADRPAKGEKLGKMGKQMAQLDLTAAQKEQLRPVLQEAQEQRKALKADTTLTPEQKKAKMKENRAATQAKINAILTPEQQQKLKELRKERKAEAKQDDAPKKTT